MALDTNYYPAQAKLILTPTNYTGGGTDLGKVASVHTASFNPQFEFLTEHGTGSIPVDARITGINVVYMLHMLDFSESLLGVLFNKTNNTDRWQGFTGYNLGALLGTSQLSKFLVMPIVDAGTVDATKPMLYIPRGVCISAFNAVWDRRAAHTSGWVLQIMALYDSTLGAPAAYGDSADFPAIT
ncbi:MAG: hypothetical protein M5U25_21140 [Planctomycetota bacterium]|nr:hypothetical protein [Planctomycetota bacterium]